jgi:hypothetical protein
MKLGMRWLVAIVGLLLLAFGLGCLNYTKADGLEHHREVAARLGIPQPGERILFGGAATLGVGGVLVGFAVGRKSQ